MVGCGCFRPSRKVHDESSTRKQSEVKDESQVKRSAIGPENQQGAHTPEAETATVTGAKEPEGGDILNVFGGLLGEAFNLASQGIAAGLESLPQEKTGNEDQVFQSLFGLSGEERLLEYFPCALEQELSILHQGKMWVSSGYLCFHSEVGGPLKVVLRLSDILSIEESSHWIVNPAIAVQLTKNSIASRSVPGCRGGPSWEESDGTAVYRFATFWDRDVTLSFLRGLSTSSASVGPAGEGSGSNDRDGHTSQTVASPEQNELSSSSTLPTLLKGRDSEFQVIHECRIPLSLETYFNRWMADDANAFKKYHDQLDHKELQIGKWEPASSSHSLAETRTVKFRAPCSHWMCPPSTRVVETHMLLRTPSHKPLVWEVTLQSLDVPYGECFVLELRWKFESDVEDSSSFRAQVSLNVHFVRRCVWESKIKSGAISEMKTSISMYFDFLKSHVAS